MKKKLLDIYVEILHRYEDLIADYNTNVDNWQEYGSYSSCLFCRELDMEGNDYYNCHKCPLSTLTGDGCPCVTDAFNDLEIALFYGNKRCIIKTATARYKELVNHLESLGYEYV